MKTMLPTGTRGAGLRLLFCALLLVAAAGRTVRAAEGRPNLILIYTDDQRWDALGVVQREQGEKARFPWLKTPHLDRLASEGVRFRNAFVVNALCAPSRATFLTGKYGHANGVVNNHTPFPTDSVTHASLMRAAGYRTGYVGKWHMGSQRGQRPGFDYSASFVGQGKYFDCPIEVNGEPVPSQGWVDDVSTDYALRFVRENRDRPFSLTLGFKTCHGPFEPPARHRNTYAGEQARTVPNLGVPAIYNGPRRNPAPLAGDRVPTNLNYFRGITAIDENVGRLLALLDELKLADNTLVVFTSDNGYYLGEHNLGDKRSAYEESMRVPLLVRYPRLKNAGKVVDRLALNTDLAPTFLDYGGLAVPNDLHGRSWRPLLEDRPTDWRQAFFYGYFYETGFQIPTVTAVRTETAKLIRYPGHEEWSELFELRQDPYEIRNRFADPEAAPLRKELEAEYERQKTAIGFRIPPFADDPARDEPRPALNAWVLDYRFDRDEGDRVIDASGRNNHGSAHNAPVVDGRDGKKARRFDGTSYLEVPKAPSLNPGVKGWTVEATFKATAPNGIVLACGGQSNGYCLSLVDGKPVFTLVAQSRPFQVKAARSVVGEWVRVVARVKADRRLSLTLDGAAPVAAPARQVLTREPNEGLQIGADLNTTVLGGEPLPRFTGLLEAVRIYSGDVPL